MNCCSRCQAVPRRTNHDTKKVTSYHFDVSHQLLQLRQQLKVFKYVKVNCSSWELDSQLTLPNRLPSCFTCVYRPETQQKAPVSAPPPPPPPPPPPEPAGPPEPEEEILGSDDEEQEDPADYCKGQNNTQTDPRTLKSFCPSWLILLSTSVKNSTMAALSPLSDSLYVFTLLPPSLSLSTSWWDLQPCCSFRQCEMLSSCDTSVSRLFGCCQKGTAVILQQPRMPDTMHYTALFDNATHTHCEAVL